MITYCISIDYNGIQPFVPEKRLHGYSCNRNHFLGKAQGNYGQFSLFLSVLRQKKDVFY